MPSVAEIYLEQGRRRADAERRRGESSANLAMNIGNQFAGAVQQIGQHYADAPKREFEKLQLAAAKGSAESAQKEAQAEARLRELFATNPAPDPRAIIGIVGPERGTKIVTGLLALQDTDMQRFKTQQEIVAATLGGMDALPENLRAEIYPDVRKTLIGRNVISEQDAPATYDPNWFQQARNFGQAAPKPKEGFTLNPGDVRFGPDGKEIAKVEPKPEKLTFGAPTPAMVGGKRVFIRSGSDGKTYDLRGKELAVDPTPIAPEGPQASFTRAEIVLPDGTIKTANYNSRTGKYTDVDTGVVLQGVGRAPTDKDISAVEGKEKMRGIVNALSGLSEKINTRKGVMATINGKEERAKAAINLNDDVAEYQSIIDSFTPIIARALGHTGVLTQMDVDSAKAMFPKPEDSKSLRDRKVARLNELLRLDQKSGSGSTPAPKSADPLGIRKGGGE